MAGLREASGPAVRYLLLALLLLAACGAPPTEVVATEKVKARRIIEEAEEFHAETLRAIDDAEAAVQEAERVIAEQQAKERQDRLRASRTATTARSAPSPPLVVDEAFWRRLANCESANGTGGNGGGYFQFSPDTARRVGYRPGMSYEEQRALAVKWLGMINGRGGSRSGWPVCWWRAVA